MDSVLFWMFVALVSLSAIWASHLSRRESERTIRRAIEQGIQLDAETVRRLKGGDRLPIFMVAGGFVLLAVACGLVVFAYIIAPQEPDTLVPLLGIAAFLGIPAAATAAAGFWLMRRFKREAGE